MIALIATLIPVLGLAVASTATMTGRQNETVHSIQRHRALLAAESGVDMAIYRARSGQLNAGDNFEGTLGSGMSFSATSVHWLTDRIDNDGDRDVDEADEDIIEVTVAGTYQGTQRRLAVQFAVTTAVEAPTLPAALYLPNSNIDVQGDDEDFWISGLDKDINGRRASSPTDTLGVATPNVRRFVRNLTRETERGIEGIASESRYAGRLSVDEPATILDLRMLVRHARTNADRRIRGGSSHERVSWGNSARGQYELIYCDGDLQLGKNFRGAGVLVVAGTLQGQEWRGFDGIILALGDTQLQECPIKGSLLMGADVSALQMQKSHVDYSTEVINGIQDLLPDGFLASGDGVVRGGTGPTTFTFVGWEGLSNH